MASAKERNLMAKIATGFCKTQRGIYELRENVIGKTTSEKLAVIEYKLTELQKEFARTAAELAGRPPKNIRDAAKAKRGEAI